MSFPQFSHNTIIYYSCSNKSLIRINTNTCRVVESKCAEFAACCDLVVAQYGWQTHTISSAAKVGPDRISKIDPSLPFRPSTALGVLGMPG